MVLNDIIKRIDTWIVCDIWQYERKQVRPFMFWFIPKVSNLYTGNYGMSNRFTKPV